MIWKLGIWYFTPPSNACLNFKELQRGFNKGLKSILLLLAPHHWHENMLTMTNIGLSLYGMTKFSLFNGWVYDTKIPPIIWPSLLVLSENCRIELCFSTWSRTEPPTTMRTLGPKSCHISFGALKNEFTLNCHTLSGVQQCKCRVYCKWWLATIRWHHGPFASLPNPTDSQPPRSFLSFQLLSKFVWQALKKQNQRGGW